MENNLSMRSLRFLKFKILIIFALTFGQMKAQTILTLQPDSTTGKDAFISGLGTQANTNYGNSTEFDAGTWNNGTVQYSIRSLVQFNLTSVPANANIISAYLSLYYNPNNIRLL